MMWSWFNGGYGGFWGMWFMPIIMIVVCGLIIWGIVALARHGWAWCCGQSSQQYSDSALDVLKRRYAVGEIGKEEFEDKKKQIA